MVGCLGGGSLRCGIGLADCDRRALRREKKGRWD